MKRFLLLGLFLLCFIHVQAQKKNKKDLTIDLPNKETILELENSLNGQLHTRVQLKSTKNSYPLQSNVAGMMVYNTATVEDVKPGIYYNDGLQWVFVFNAVDKGMTIINNDNKTWIYNPTSKKLGVLKGPDDKSVISGITAPNNVLGNNGDTYINTTTGDTYIYNGAIWTLTGSIKSSKGNSGATGLFVAPGYQGVPDEAVKNTDFFSLNVFTPNGDGINDTFQIRGLNKFPQNEIVIVNDLGDKVFKAKNYQNNWTGQKMEEGAYSYYLKVKETPKSSWETYKGNILLVR